ncbi:MAG TPA: hypothetical protein VLA68_00080 [Nitrososphaera sp.]|nr:hypothetical protein [Nitrososphaera sp.]
MTKAYPTQKFRLNTIGDCVDYLTTILSRVNMYPESSFAKWHVDNFYDGVSDGIDICIRWHKWGKAHLDLIS